MTIKTKYNIGQEHWLIESQMAQKEVCKSIHIEVSDCGDAPPKVKIEYKMNGGRYVIEDAIVESKQDLLNSL